jgi:hypothetical protein
MKRAPLLLLGLALLCVPAHAATNITRITGCQASATSCTISGFLPGDLSIAFAYRSSSTTHPTLPAIYNSIDCATGANTNSSCTGYKFLNGNETTCGTWTNATQVICEIYRGADMQATLGPIGGHTTTGASSATLNYNTITLTGTVGLSTSSYVVGFGGCAACANADAAPTNMTLRTGTSITNIAGSDTNVGVASWPTTGVTITSGSWRSETVEILSAPNTASLATVDAHIVRDDYYGCSNCGNVETNGNTFFLPLIGAIGANNHPMLFIEDSYTTSAPTVTISCSVGTSPGSWTQEKVLNDSGNTFWEAIYGIAGATGGCTQLEVVFSAAVISARFHFIEETQLATSSVVDVSAAQSNSSQQFAGAGTLTTTQANDLIYQACDSPSLLGQITDSGAWAASGEYLLTAEGINGSAATGISGVFQDQIFIQTSSGAITPMFETDGFSNTSQDCIAVAYKTSPGTGTPLPGGIQAISQYFFATDGVATTNFQYLIPANATATIVNNGNLGTGNPQFTSLSDGLSNTWWHKSATGGSTGVFDFAGDCAPTPGVDFITLTGITAANASGTAVISLAGSLTGSSTSCYDSSASVSTASGLTTPAGFATAIGVGSTTDNGPSITPSTATGITFAAINENAGPVLAITAPTGAILTCPVYTGQTDGSRMCLGNAYNSIYYNPNTTIQNWVWTNSTTQSWGASAIHILPQPPTGCASRMTLVGTGC